MVLLLLLHRQRDMRAEEAAIKCHRERGYVVIGFTDALEGPVNFGDSLDHFAGGSLTGHVLIVEQDATRAEWDDQVQFLFSSWHIPRNPIPAKRQRFYRCRLETKRA